MNGPTIVILGDQFSPQIASLRGANRLFDLACLRAWERFAPDRQDQLIRDAERFPARLG